MKLKLACADFTFPLLSHDQVLDLIALLGFEGVDIGVFGGRSHLPPGKIVKNIAGSARVLSEKLRNRGLEFADIFLIPGDFGDLAPNHIDPRERRKSRDMFLRILEFTVRCNAGHMSGLPGISWKGEPSRTSLQRSADELAWRVEQARQVGIVFSVEPHVGSITPTPAEALQLVKMTPGLTLTLDYGHFTQAGLPDSTIEPLVRHASHFHVRGTCKGRLQASFKENTVNYARVLKVMNQTNYKGYLEIEYVWVDWEHCNETDNVSETILFRDYLKSIKLH
jgi:sugar phosphate isomerase/epimerase